MIIDPDSIFAGILLISLLCVMFYFGVWRSWSSYGYDEINDIKRNKERENEIKQNMHIDG